MGTLGVWAVLFSKTFQKLDEYPLGPLASENIVLDWVSQHPFLTGSILTMCFGPSLGHHQFTLSFSGTSEEGALSPSLGFSMSTMRLFKACSGGTLMSSCPGETEHLICKGDLSPKEESDMLAYIRNCISGGDPLMSILEFVRINDFVFQKLPWPGWIDMFSVPHWQRVCCTRINQKVNQLIPPLSILPRSPVRKLELGTLSPREPPGLFIYHQSVPLFLSLRCSCLYFVVSLLTF